MENKKKDYWKNQEMIIKDEIKDPNEITKNILNIILLLGSLSFLITGISSYTNIKILMFIDPKEITFFPQGATMSFYGILGIAFSINQILITYAKVGEGFNKFDKYTGKINIYRKGFFGTNENINLLYEITDIV